MFIIHINFSMLVEILDTFFRT